MKASIADFSGKPQGNISSEANSDQEALVSGYAVNYFGGCASKRTKAWLSIPLALALFCLMIFVKFYLLKWLGGNKPARERIMKASHIKQVVSSVWRKMGPTRYLSSSRSVHNSNKSYHGRTELESHTDTAVLGRAWSSHIQARSAKCCLTVTSTSPLNMCQ